MKFERSALLVGLVAFACYLPASWWGAPHATAADRAKSWGVDDETPLGPLAEMANIVDPKPDRNFGYPLMYSFMSTAAYAPYLGFLKVTGRMQGASAVYPYGLEDPVRTLKVLTLLAHLITVLCGVTAVVAAWATANALWGRTAGFLAAAFALTLYPMFYYSRTGNVDVPMLAFMTLAVAGLARALAAGMTMRRAVWIGVFAGLALATKEAAVGVLAPVSVLVLVLGWRAGGWKIPAAALATSFLALGIGSGMFIEPSRWIEHVRFISGRVRDVSSSASVPEAYPFTSEGNLGFARALLSRYLQTLTLPGLLLGVGGAIIASIRDRRAALLAIAIPCYVLMEFFLMRAAQLRYVLPASWLLALFAGWAAWAAWESRRAALRVPVVALAAVALALQLVYGLSLTWEMLRDSRLAAGSFIAERVRPGDRVDIFGAQNKTPPVPTGVTTERPIPFYGMWTVHRTDAAIADSIRRFWAASPPALVIVMPDHSTREPGTPYDASMPPSLYEEMAAGSGGMREVAFFQTPPLIPWLRRPPLDYPSVNPPIRIFAPLR